ncbi:hypothetical protein CBW65_22350 [Tumebacillus avium]|uniref:Uncharacterized protein n=1 Tax=Tumebacillus avium TaxID=1903704 RepID=A0A1Y0IS38_9BACL|nr:hypothetical protein [Tumebacillus avium]ARU63428.1 hypothetical protein CBW65_22350 [Tumebacillus avium]
MTVFKVIPHIWQALLMFASGSICLYVLLIRTEKYNRLTIFSVTFGCYVLSFLMFCKHFDVLVAYYGMLLIMALIISPALFVAGIAVAYLRGPRLQKERMRVAFVMVLYLAGGTILFLGLVVLAARLMK